MEQVCCLLFDNSHDRSRHVHGIDLYINGGLDHPRSSIALILQNGIHLDWISRYCWCGSHNLPILLDNEETTQTTCRPIVGPTDCDDN